MDIKLQQIYDVSSTDLPATGIPFDPENVKSMMPVLDSYTGETIGTAYFVDLIDEDGVEVYLIGLHDEVTKYDVGKLNYTE